MEKNDYVFPREILLSDEVAARDKHEREFKIYAKLEPIIRIVAIGLVTCLAVAFAFFGYTNFSPAAILLYSFITFVIHGGGTWFLLWRFLWRHPIVYDIVAVTDFLFMTIGVYFTGGESSFLFFIYITRIADQITVKDKKRVLYFAVLAPLFYALMLLYISAVDRREINFQIESIKILSLFGCSAYLMVVGRSVAHIKAKMVSFLHAAKIAYRMLDERKRELEKLNDQKNEFFGIVAHELRNPLNAIEGFVGLIIQDIKDKRFSPEQGQYDLQTVLTSTQRMSHLINDLLDLSAIESGKVHLNLSKASLFVILDHCEKFNSRSAAQKNIKLIIDRTINPPEIMMDQQKLMNVVDNLLSNAIKYTHPGGEIRVDFEQNVAELITHVRDTGQGLTKKDLEHVFSSFKMLSPRPTAGESSTGLGLAIVKKIVELHRGRIWVNSVKGQGSTFSFSLPLC